MCWTDPLFFWHRWRRSTFLNNTYAPENGGAMGTEIERKFLVISDSWRQGATGVAIRQGYLSSRKECAVRVRVSGGKGYLTVKGMSVGITRQEFEYEIPVEEAHAMLDTLAERPLIEKTRYTLAVDGLLWEIDEFSGENSGLIIAEVELEDAAQQITPPSWAGRDVSDDPRYFNANLVRNPYCTWTC